MSTPKLAGGTLILALAGALIWWAPWAGSTEDAAGQPPAAAGEEEPARPVTPRFTYLRTTTYSAAGQPHEIKEFRHASTGLEFVLVPAGQLRRSATDKAPEAEAPVAAFLMAKTEVPQAVWKAVMGNNPSRRKRDNLPVDTVSWVQARDFCRKTGLALPSELEWEYACRAGTETPFYWGEKMDTAYCWVEANAMEQTRPVGTRRPNAFGLHDMIGNVYEWCESWFHQEGMRFDPENDALGGGERALRVLRGGCAASQTCCAYSASRSGNWPAKATEYDGVRPIARLADAELVGGE